MNFIARRALNSLLPPTRQGFLSQSGSLSWLCQQSRGIRVKVLNGNLEQALTLMQRKMTSSGIERLIKRQPTRHIKNSEKRVLARKSLLRRIQSDDLARKLQTILIRKVRGL